MKFIVVTHESMIGRGPAHELYDFLKDTNEVLFISHPLLYFKQDYDRVSYFELSRNGKIQKEKGSKYELPSVLLFLKDFIYTIFWSYKIDGRADIFFGVDPLNALAGLLLRKLGKVKKVVYYSIDFSPKRFGNPILNSIYHNIEKFCCEHVDAVWIGTQATMKAWQDCGYNTKKIKKTIIVPDGNHSKSIKLKKTSEIDKNTIVYIGTIAKKQGIDLVLESLPSLTQKIKDLKFIVIGDGGYLDELKGNARTLNLKNVDFKGHLEDDEAEKLLLSCSIGVATYSPDKDSFTFYSEAGKPKYYLGCGLPVIITNVPAIATRIGKERAGIVVDYTTESFVNAVETILGNYDNYRNNAIKLGRQFDWSNIFKNALDETTN